MSDFYRKWTGLNFTDETFAKLNDVRALRSKARSVSLQAPAPARQPNAAISAMWAKAVDAVNARRETQGKA